MVKRTSRPIGSRPGAGRRERQDGREVYGQQMLVHSQIRIWGKWTGQRDIHGVVRFPKNLIIGVRSACAAEARKALVANIST
jgi:hypothetical protein